MYIILHKLLPRCVFAYCKSLNAIIYKLNMSIYFVTITGTIYVLHSQILHLKMTTDYIEHFTDECM